MQGIPLIDVRIVSARYARSALPEAPVIADEQRRPRKGWRTRKLALGSRRG
jgi:hypothetical protein